MEIRTTHGEHAGGPGRAETACRLVRAHDAMQEHPDLDGEGLQLWLDFEEAAFRCGVDPNLPREELVAAAGDLGCPSCRPVAAAATPSTRPEAA